MPQSYYDILGVTHDATEDQIRGAYRRLSKALHPDINKRQTAESEFKELNLAFHTLVDPLQRHEYNALQRRAKVADVPPDAVDIAFASYEIMKPKKKKSHTPHASGGEPKKKRKKKAPKNTPRANGGEPSGQADYEAIPDGYTQNMNLGGIL